MTRNRRATVVAVAALVVAALLVTTRIRRRRAPHAVRRPRTVIAEARRPETSTLVVCVGDSLTAGKGSADWVGMLAERLGPQGYEFVNAGVNSNLAWNVLQRLDEVIACDPDVITLLVGSNDVLATLSPAHEARYRKYQRLRQRPTLEWYGENVDRILDRLAAQTRARLVVLDLPLLGEALDSELNRRVERYNDVLRERCELRRVLCIPLNRRLAELLPPDHRAPAWSGSTGPMFAAAARRLLLRQDWNTISEAQGLRLLTDHIHLNETAAARVADLVSDALTAPERDAVVPTSRRTRPVRAHHPQEAP